MSFLEKHIASIFSCYCVVCWVIMITAIRLNGNIPYEDHFMAIGVTVFAPVVLPFVAFIFIMKMVLGLPL